LAINSALAIKMCSLHYGIGAACAPAHGVLIIDAIEVTNLVAEVSF